MERLSLHYIQYMCGWLCIRTRRSSLFFSSFPCIFFHSRPGSRCWKSSKMLEKSSPVSRGIAMWSLYTIYSRLSKSRLATLFVESISTSQTWHLSYTNSQFCVCLSSLDPSLFSVCTSSRTSPVSSEPTTGTVAVCFEWLTMAIFHEVIFEKIVHSHFLSTSCEPLVCYQLLFRPYICALFTEPR